jgi:putative peptidoglycan lipid II flippase
VLITVPIAIGFGVFAVPVVSDLLERGRFTVDDSRVVGWLIICFMGLFIGASWGELLARGFYTFGDTRTPTVVGAIALTIGLACKWFSLPVLGVWGIALSTSLYILLSAVTMAYLLSVKTNTGIFSGCWTVLVQALLASCVACGMCLIPYTFQLGRTWSAAPLGAVTYVAVLWLLGNSDARNLQDWLIHNLKARLRPRGGKLKAHESD